MEQENFLYFGRRPTNVCYNGTSFPVMPGDVVRCYREFWEAFVTDERLYKTIPDDDPRKPKYKFGRSPIFIKHDPVGGLPVRSDSTPGANPRLREAMKAPIRRDPDLSLDEAPINPYDLGVDEEELTVDISTSPDLPSAPDPEREKADFTTALPSSSEELAEVVVEPPKEEEKEENFGIILLGRSALRKLTKDEVFAECKRLADAGCPHNPDLLGTFLSFDDDTTRGVMFPELWEYCGYNA